MNEVLKEIERRMLGAVEACRTELARLRTGRASLALLDGITVDYYGSPTPLNQVASLSVPEPTTILIAPWLISDYQGAKMNPHSWTSRLLVALGVGFALAGPFLDLKPVLLMTATMALLAIVLPFSVVAITVLLNQKHVGSYKNSWLLNLACLAALAFSVVMSYYGVIGISETVRDLLAA